MCHLLSDSTPKVQIMSYQFLQQAARRRTEYLVVESGVDTESAVKVELPLELIALLQRDSELENDSEQDEQVCGKTIPAISNPSNAVYLAGYLVLAACVATCI
jgi:hypothetical protein